MAYRDIRIIGDPVLRTECDWITDIDDSVKSLVEDLLETVDEVEDCQALQELEDRVREGVGLPTR